MVNDGEGEGERDEKRDGERSRDGEEWNLFLAQKWCIPYSVVVSLTRFGVAVSMPAQNTIKPHVRAIQRFNSTK